MLTLLRITLLGVLCSLLLCGLPLRASAADAGSTLNVAVSDVAGAPLAGVLIAVTGASIEGESNAITDAQGNASLDQLPPGEYTVRAAQDGYQEVARTVQLRLGRSVRLNIKLLSRDG